MSAITQSNRRSIDLLLEPGQLVAVTARPLPRRPLAIRLKVGLWGLRIVVLVLTGLVVSVFVSGL
jgi:hypothetical protein